jgi:hypothetical protein
MRKNGFNINEGPLISIKLNFFRQIIFRMQNALIKMCVKINFNYISTRKEYLYLSRSKFLEKKSWQEDVFLCVSFFEDFNFR